MRNSTLNSLLKDYEQKKYIADVNFEKEKNSFYNSHPELNELKSELGKLALDISKAILNGDVVLEKKLKNEFAKLTSKKDNLLKSLDIPKRRSRAFI